MKLFLKKLIAAVLLLALLASLAAVAFASGGLEVIRDPSLIGRFPNDRFPGNENEDPEPTDDPIDDPTDDPGPTETPGPWDDPGTTPGVTPGPSGGEDLPALNPDVGKTKIRVGLQYDDGVMDGANLGNATGSGFYFGYYNSENRLVPVGYTSQGEISIVKTENVYYGTYGGYTSYHDNLTNASVGVGCYHLQVSGSFASFEEASLVAGMYDGGFVAYVNGTYYVRIGNYLNRDAAVEAQFSYAQSGVPTELKGTSSYGLSVVVTGTNRIIFQYDDNGSGTGLGVEPIPTYTDEKCSTYYKNKKWYGGFRYERINGGNLTIVNVLELDDYVKGVVPHEMSPSWPMEALKAQAVAARTYALYNLNRHKRNHFDICCTTCCQYYLGQYYANETTDAAVDSTAGQMIYYNDKIIGSYYYASNGGASEDSSVVWGSRQESYPYLLGVVDPYEATVADTISGYNWTREYTGDELAEKLHKAGYTKCATVVAAKVSSYTSTGNPKTITFTDENGKDYTLSALAVMKYFSFSSWRYDFVSTSDGAAIINGDTVVDSISGLYVIDGFGNRIPINGETCYVIGGDGTVGVLDTGNVARGETFTIKGAGKGHNVGMSQHGARAMALLGYDYLDIIKFYYTGVTVR